MKKLLKFIFFLMITAALLYAVNDKYNLAEWVSQIGEANNFNNPDNFADQVRLAMLEGKEHTVLQYYGDVDDMEWFTNGAIDMVYNIDESTTSSDYDFLRYNTNSIYSHISGLGYIMTVTYNIQYNESKSETDQVDQKISKLFHKWKIEKLSDYDKIKKIHDYIINNASYDLKLQNYSAYDNLIEQSSTCQGYMSIAYKMLTQAGIPCRIISGTADGESHGWNIVKLDGKWYNLDCTWDDPLTSSGEEVLVYDYFLKSDDVFKDHVRDEEYRTEAFYQEYEMSSKSYEE